MGIFGSSSDIRTKHVPPGYDDVYCREVQRINGLDRCCRLFKGHEGWHSYKEGTAFKYWPPVEPVKRCSNSVYHHGVQVKCCLPAGHGSSHEGVGVDGTIYNWYHPSGPPPLRPAPKTQTPELCLAPFHDWGVDTKCTKTKDHDGRHEGVIDDKPFEWRQGMCLQYHGFVGHWCNQPLGHEGPCALRSIQDDPPFTNKKEEALMPSITVKFVTGTGCTE